MALFIACDPATRSVCGDLNDLLKQECSSE